jgi:hypothetical protein
LYTMYLKASLSTTRPKIDPASTMTCPWQPGHWIAEPSVDASSWSNAGYSICFWHWLQPKRKQNV